MACIKCGKKTEEAQVFCPQCRQVLANYPVKPGTAVQIPVRPDVPQERTARKKRRVLSTKQSLRQLVVWLTVIIAAMTVVICILTGLLLKETAQNPGEPMGRNYSVDTSTMGGN